MHFYEKYIILLLKWRIIILLKQDIKQQMIFSQKMALNLSILQMSRIQLNIYISEIADSNPLISISNYFVPWKNKSSVDVSDIIENTISQEQKLFDLLREELVLDLEEQDLPLLYLIIGSLTPQGFLPISSKSLCKNTSYDPDIVEKIRLKIMESSFLGLATLNSKEYLLFVTKHKFQQESLEYKIAKILVTNNNKKIVITALSKTLKTEPLQIEHALARLKTISQTPLDKNITRPIYPDFIVSIESNDLIITPSALLTPKITILDYHRSHYTKKELDSFLKESTKIQTALALRTSALQKHAEALILTRSDFFFKNSTLPKDIKLKDIAAITGRHISTVSRALKHRYFLFEGTIYSFSDLWIHKIGNSDDYTIKKKIIQIIANENTSPLSDSSITTILRKQGIKIARRTINKYRKELKINSSYQR